MAWMDTHNIVLQVDIMNDGLIVEHEKETQTFRGSRAFQKCLAHVIGNEEKADELINVWDGYFNITLGTFQTQQDVENRVEYDEVACLLPNISEIMFQSSELRVVRIRHQSNMDDYTVYVDLMIDPTHEIRDFHHNLEPLFKTIRAHTNPHRWKINRFDDLIVSLGKFNGATCKPSKRIYFPDKPIKFKCSDIQIIPTGKGAREKYLIRKSKGIDTPWWIGAIEIDGKCSACGVATNGDWPGHCRSCGTVQRVKPLWSYGR